MTNDTLLLGPAPRPTEGSSFAEALRAALQRELTPDFAGLDRMGVTAALDGADIASLDVVMTGVTTAMTTRPTPPALPGVEAAQTEPGRLRHATFEARPFVLEGAKVEVTGSVDNMPLEWVTTADGQYGLRLNEPTDAADPVTGGGQASISKADLEALANTAAAELAEPMGVHVQNVTLDIKQLSPRQLAVTAEAKVKKGFISAPAQVTAQATVDDAMVITISGIEAGSRNPVVNGLLSLVRGKVEQFNGKKLAVNDKLPAGLKISSAEFQVSDTITVRGTIG